MGLPLAFSSGFGVNSPVRALIVGCGYVGLPLGQALVQAGHQVSGLRRSASSAEELQRAGLNPIIADITRRADLDKISGAFDWIINTVASSGGGVEDYRAVYLRGTCCLIDWLSARPPQKYIHTSSTSVYAQTDGSTVTEESPAEPSSETSRVLVETERALLHAAREKNFPALILRVAGIYGPERGHPFKQYLRGEARISGDGSRLMNMIHRDDVVRAILAALERGRPGEIYNATDDEPVTQRNFFTWLASKLDGPLPSPAAEPEDAERKRGLAQKRVSNRKLRQELGCELKYPTFRQGYAAEMERLESSGKLLRRGCGK